MRLSYLCAPSLGSLEQWLPIIWKLDKKDIEFDIIIPKPLTAQQFNLNNKLVYISSKYFKNYYLKSYSGRFVKSQNIYEMKNSFSKLKL